MGKIGITGVLLIAFFWSCNGVNKEKQAEADVSVPVTIIADESFAPVIDEEAYVFESDYVKEKVNIIYKPEVKLLNMLMSDSSKVVIMSRQLSAQEKKVFENKKIIIRVNRFAIDGVALITNSASKDSTITVEEIVNIMKGKPGKTENLVFDNANSSTVRYLKELSGVKDLPRSGVYALTSNPEVIKYVYDNPGSIGVVGINWIVRPDKENEQYAQKVRLMGVKNLPGKPGSDKFYMPDQSTLALGLYPLTRDLYIINCQGGLLNFASFIAGEKGQRIVLKSGLMPDKLPSREIMINNN